MQNQVQQPAKAFENAPSIASVRQTEHREANHDTAEADQSAHEFGRLFPPKEFECGVPCGHQERFRDRAEQASHHSG